MYRLLVLCSTVGSASVVHYKYDVSTLSHIHLPMAKRCLEVVAYHLRVRTSIYIEDYGISLCWIKIERLYQTVIVVVTSVCAAYASQLNGRVVELRCGIFGCEKFAIEFAVCRAHTDYAWNIERGVVVREVGSIWRYRAGVPALLFRESHTLAATQIDLHQMTLYWRDLGRVVIYRACILSEVLHVGIHAC